MVGRVVTAVSLVVVAGVVLWLRQIGYEEAGRRIAPMGWWAPVAASAILAALVVTPGVTSDLFGVISGALFGPVGGGLVNWLGAMVGSVTCYAIGWRLGGRPWVIGLVEHLPPRMRWAVSSLPFLLFVRYLPAIGGTVVNYSAGAVRVSLRRFLWTAAISTLPPAWFWALVGYASRS